MNDQNCQRCGSQVERDFYCISCGLVPPYLDKEHDEEALAEAA